MTDEPSPRPWRVNSVTGGHISDANGNPVCFCVGSNCGERAALIVDAVNNADSWRSACIKARTERNAFLLERDRLRDIVRRLLMLRRGDIVVPMDMEKKILAEARAAIGEDEK